MGREKCKRRDRSISSIHSIPKPLTHWQLSQMPHSLKFPFNRQNSKSLASSQVTEQPMTKILVIEDEELVRANILEMLEAEEFETVGAANGQVGVQLAKQELPDLILCDVMMPELDGYSVLSALRELPETASIPFIFLTAKASKSDLRAGMELGADDYLTKPFSRNELLGAIATRLEKQSRLRSHYTRALRQVAERLNHIVHYDSLTNLPNRLLLQERFNSICQLLANPEMQNAPIPIFLVSLDRFHRIHEALERQVGELLLKNVAQRLAASLDPQDTIAHISIDQFALILSPRSQHRQDFLKSVDRVETNSQSPKLKAFFKVFAQAILDLFKQPFLLGAHEIFMTASIGISIYAEDGKDLDTLIKRADLARKQAQSHGGNQYQFYQAEMKPISVETLAIETDLRRAIVADQFQVLYQPQIDLKTGEIIGAEALIRWHHPERGLMSPAQFIPIAEESDLIIALGEWVLHTACSQGKKWHELGLEPIKIAVNLSARQFTQIHLKPRLLKILQSTGFNPKYLELEVTESVLVQHVSSTIQIMNDLKALGIQISVDDFGTGYSSLIYLKQFPFDTLKIDQRFVRNLTADSRDAAITLAIIQMAHSLNLKVIAEGVETDAELAVLRQNQCDAIQGYLFSRPIPACEFEVFLNTHRTLYSR